MNETDQAPQTSRGESDRPVPARRTYVAPELIEYGSIGKLTQGGSGAFAETVGHKAHQCL